MAVFFITPFEKVGHIAFGEDRSAVRNELGEFREFRKTRLSKNTTDAFGGCHVFYDSENKVEAVELFRPEIAIYNHKNIFLFTPEQIIKLFDDSVANLSDSTLSLPSYGIEIGLEDGDIDSIFVHAKNY